MKVLWINPSFLDYRIPLYAELNKLCLGDFYLIYSKQRVPKRCVDRIESELGENALGLPKETIISLGKHSEFANSSVMLPFPKGLFKLIKNVKADLVIAEGFFQFTPWALLYTILYHRPLIIAYERTAHTERNCPLWRRMYRKLVNIFVDGYVVNGILTKEYLISQGVKGDRIFTGAMCADSIRLSTQVRSLSLKEKNKLKYSIYNKNKLGISFVFVGRMIARKGVTYLLHGWEKHIVNYPNDMLLLIGDGPDLPSYMEKCKGDSSVIFAGGIEYSQIYKYYAVSDVFIIPTLEDNWSLVVPEAMACGLPIACSIYNGCYPELVHEGENGVLFDPLNLESVVKALSYFHRVDLKEQGQKSVEIEKNYTPQKTAYNIFSALVSIKNEK